MESLACQEQEEANLHLRCESISEEEGVEQAQREVCHNTIKRSFRKRNHLEKGLSRLGSGLRGGQRVEGKILHENDMAIDSEVTSID